MHDGICFSSFFPLLCGAEASVDAQPTGQCLLTLMKAIQSEEVVKCWEKTSKSSLQLEAWVPEALICSGMRSHSPRGEWTWQLSSGAGPWSPSMTVV